MKPGQPSRTAELMALFRALETACPADRRLFTDPFAVHFLGSPLALLARIAVVPAVEQAIARFIDHRWPGTRTSAIARTRLIDDLLLASLAQGTKQLVILGAGLDSRAYRLDALATVDVYEVDHPDTLALKQARLRHARPTLPGHVHFVPTDFNLGRLPEVMRASGFDESRPTCFIWEGVTNYLSASAVDATLRWCAGTRAGNRLIFTYVDRAVLDGPSAFAGTQRLFETLRRAGETWTFGLDPTALESYLAGRGLTLQSDLSATEYRRRYLGQAADAMRGYEFYHVALAHTGR